ncbi:MAG TPA: glycosyltransferase family 39 protein [Candidatus Eisenbacteria bacterium]|nr:glycosyltransferase family 39 protein [Candidatus Eisenbacteria bacterium]
MRATTARRPAQAATVEAAAPKRKRAVLALTLALIATLAIRIAHVTWGAQEPIRSDASGYDVAARRLIATGSYAYPIGRALWENDVVRDDARERFHRLPANAWAMPGYPCFVAAIYRIAGEGPSRFEAVRLAQAVLSTAAVAGCWWIARTLFGAPVAWVALALNACYPANVLATGYLLTEALFGALLTAQVALVLRAHATGRTLDHALLGVVTAAAAYVRPVGLLVPAALPLLAWVSPPAPRGTRASRGSRAVAFAVLVLVVAALIAPWVVRNQQRYAAFVPTTSATALAIVQGELKARGMFVPEVSAQLADPARTGWNDHRYAEEVAARARALAPPLTAQARRRMEWTRLVMLGQALTTPFSFAGPPVPVTSPGFAMQAAILTLALVGLWRHRRDARVVILLGGIPLYFVAVHWAVWNLWSRYLYPVMPLLVVLAAAGMVALVSGARAARRA